MFLNQLEDVNKELFLKVCIHAAWSNGVFVNEEKEMIFAYCREMSIPEDVPEYDGTINDVLSELAEKATTKEKNIIVLEILGLVKADGVYEDKEKEKEFMDALVTGMKVKEGVLSKLNSLLDIYATVCKELFFTLSE